MKERLVSKAPLMGLYSASCFHTQGCVRTASGSDRIRKFPRIKNETSRKRITANRSEINLALLLIRSLPLAVLTRPSKRLGLRKTSAYRYGSHSNAISETAVSGSVPE
jgi:hypothetical protein